jgi:hypothetical protein
MSCAPRPRLGWAERQSDGATAVLEPVHAGTRSRRRCTWRGFGHGAAACNMLAAATMATMTIGWLGPEALAASVLGVNLNFVLPLFVIRLEPDPCSSRKHLVR